MDKAAIRAQVRAAVAALSPTKRALEEELVTAAVQAMPEWRAARTILLYRSVAPEFSTVGLVNAAWREGKRTLFPVVQGEQLLLRAADAWTAFKPGWGGIPEPTGPMVEPEAVDLALVPGVSFTQKGDRLGRGGGHFDRFLASLRCPVWGLGFDCQVLPRLPIEAHDRPVDRVLHASEVSP